MAADKGKTLDFLFTPVDEARGDVENFHAQPTTYVASDVDALKEEFGEDVLDVKLYANEHTVLVSKNRIVEVCTFLKTRRDYNYLVDLAANDRFQEEDRFEVYYNLVSVAGSKRIRIKILVDEEDATAPSITSVYRAANWNEREAYDLMGIRFDGHEDLRRMFLPEDFEYHPLRKEFPLLGIPGSLPLPPQTPEGELTMDPYAAARGNKPIKSFEESSNGQG